MRSARVVRPIDRPSILVFREEHGNRYFHVNCDDDLHRAALKVLSERFKEGYWYCKPEEKNLPKKPEYDAAGIEALPETLREEARKKLAYYKRELAYHEDEVKNYARIEKAMKEKDAKLAWECIRDAGEREYEGYSIERAEALE